MAEAGQRLILAFDYGTRRIGVAVGNELLRSARELTPLTARDGIPDWNVVSRLLNEWQRVRYEHPRSQVRKSFAWSFW